MVETEHATIANHPISWEDDENHSTMQPKIKIYPTMAAKKHKATEISYICRHNKKRSNVNLVLAVI